MSGTKFGLSLYVHLPLKTMMTSKIFKNADLKPIT